MQRFRLPMKVGFLVLSALGAASVAAIAAIAVASPGMVPGGAARMASSPSVGSLTGAGSGEAERAGEPTRGELFARWNALRGDPYALDSIERFVESEARRPKIECEGSAMVAYSGNAIRYSGIVRVNPAFQERLERFERVVAEVATEIYGRAPRRVRHYGAYVCRSARNRAHRVSEHALGNAFDVVGFDFWGATKTEPLAADAPKGLKGPFQVRVARHWTAGQSPTAKVHERFLRTLTARLEERRDVFRILIGPGHGNHADHFHFDMSPWRYVDL